MYEYCWSLQKKKISKHFVSKITDADSETSETMVWIDFLKDFKYLNDKVYLELITKYVEIGKMLGSMSNNPEKFLPGN